MTIDDVPWVTLALAVGMVTVHLVSPAITPMTYVFLAPWMHAGLGHLSENLLVFVLLGAWVERRVGWLTYLFAAVMLAYLALYVPVATEYGSLSRGTSGLTMILTGYAVPVLLIVLAGRIESIELEAREVAVGLGVFLVLVYLTVDAWVTIQRFAGFEPRPDGVAVASHATGLALGVLWFAWRGWRHGFVEA